jgi:hypothetical protein
VVDDASSDLADDWLGLWDDGDAIVFEEQIVGLLTATEESKKLMKAGSASPRHRLTMVVWPGRHAVWMTPPGALEPIQKGSCAAIHLMRVGSRLSIFPCGVGFE